MNPTEARRHELCHHAGHVPMAHECLPLPAPEPPAASLELGPRVDVEFPVYILYGESGASHVHLASPENGWPCCNLEPDGLIPEPAGSWAEVVEKSEVLSLGLCDGCVARLTDTSRCAYIAATR